MLTTANARPCAVKALKHVIGHANEDVYLQRACLIVGQTAACRDLQATTQIIHDNETY